MEAVNSNGYGALLTVCCKNNSEDLPKCIEFLLNAGVNVDALVVETNNSLLFVCAYYRRENRRNDVVHLLVHQCKIDVEWTNSKKLGRFIHVTL